MTTHEQLWAVVRDSGHGPAEVLAVCELAPTANTAAAELGEGHHAAPVPLVRVTDTVQVAHTWSCRVVVDAGAVQRVEAPTQLPGASRLVLDEAEEPVERVVVDEEAGALEAAVHSRSLVYVTGYAEEPSRARELAVARAREIGGATP